MKRLLPIFFSKQFARFLGASGTALLLNWLARFAFELVLPFWLAVVGAYCIGMASGYLLNRWLVFPGAGRSLKAQVAIFVAVNLMAFPFVWGLSILLGDMLLPRIVAPELAHGLGHGAAICAPVLANFLLHKFWTFRAAPVRDRSNA